MATKNIDDITEELLSGRGEGEAGGEEDGGRGDITESTITVDDAIGAGTIAEGDGGERVKEEGVRVRVKVW